jgi:hypothetical protein
MICHGVMVSLNKCLSVFNIFSSLSRHVCNIERMQKKLSTSMKSVVVAFVRVLVVKQRSILCFFFSKELALLQYLASSLITIAVPIPRMFFQRLQQTIVQVQSNIRLPYESSNYSCFDSSWLFRPMKTKIDLYMNRTRSCLFKFMAKSMPPIIVCLYVQSNKFSSKLLLMNN